MHRHYPFASGLLVLCALVACTHAPAKVAPDSGFAAMQERGHMAMGVDQYTSTHTFDALPEGGRIALVRDVDDTVGVQQIRAHLRLIQHAFEAGDFSTPEFVHMKQMPGTTVMAQKRAAITYTYADLARGGELRIASRDPAALAAIHEFMDAQRRDHHAMGAGMAAP
jgi:hypothetical protein